MAWVEMSRRHLCRAQSKHALLLAALAAATAAGPVAAATDASSLPADLLEYLGSWEADDADWLVANAAASALAPTASAAVQKPPNPTMTEKRRAAQATATTEHKP